MIRYGSLVFWFLLNSVALNSDAQTTDISYRPGLASYNLLNFATGGLTETLTGGSRLFEYGQKPEKQTTNEQPKVYQQNNQQRVNYVDYQQQNNNQQRTNIPQPINYQSQNTYQQPSSACANFFSYRIDQNEKFAIVTLPNPDRVRNVLKVQMSLGVRITTVNIKNGRTDYKSVRSAFSTE
jgi:hypothetical protein